MKKTKWSWIYFILELVFFLALPCFFVWLQYGKTEVEWYKVSMTGIVILLLIFMIFKKIFITPIIVKINAQIAQIEIVQLAALEPSIILGYKKKYRSLSIKQLIFNTFVPALILSLTLMTIKVVEAGAIKMYNVLLICAISIVVGLICKIGEIYSLKCEHEVDNE